MECGITEEWDELLSAFPENKKDIYFTGKYQKLYETPGSKALCAVCRDGDRIMLMPYLRGEIKGYYDFETAYGYGGPLSNCDDIGWCRDAFDKIYDHLKENNYLCGFIRFHPLLGNEKLVRADSSSRNIQVIYDRKTVAIDTLPDIEDIRAHQFSSKNRNMIRKAEKSDLVYKTEYDYTSYNEFIELYRSTMRRLSADSFYFFDDRYFDELKMAFSGKSFLGTVRKNGKLICAAVFLFSDIYGHYHLAGSDREYPNLGANNFLLWNVSCEMHSLGIHEFHLGGGTSSSPEDHLYKFKKVFSSNEKSFFICKVIFEQKDYLSICHEWETLNKDKIPIYGNRLLKYRYTQ